MGDKLAPPTEAQWKTSSGFHGDWKKEEMRRSLTRTASDHWFHMRKPDSRVYKTTSNVDLCHPTAQRPPVMAPHMPEDGGGLRTRNGSLGFQPFVLHQYRSSWTSGDSDRFAKPALGWIQ